MFWQVETVADEELTAAEWAITEIDGEFLVICRESALEADPGRITVEVVAALRAARCPRRAGRRAA